jgi:hypothetical protein
MPDFQLKTPVVLVIFNRPDTTEIVFAEIAKARPPKLLVIGDGPRPDRQGEAEKVAACRAIIKRVDWDCEVLTNLSDTNLGCGQRPASGFDWVFQQVEEAIILEDDCLPHPSFFRYCEEMLERFRDDQRIAVISGDNFQFGYRRNDDSYYFSRYVYPWGWATWRDRWQGSYDYSMSSWPIVRDEGGLNDMLTSRKEVKYWTFIFETVYQAKNKTCWDYQWMFACWLQGRLSVQPNLNLIKNIGFGPNATHTVKGGELANIPVEEMQFPLKHPLGVICNRTLDARDFKRRWWSFRLVIARMVRMLRRLLKI